MENIHQLRKMIHETCNLQRFGVLATVHQNQPYTSLVAFALSVDLGKLVFVTPRATRKFNYLVENSNVSFMVDNRTNESSDIVESIGITISGTAREPDNDEKKPLTGLYLQKHPHMKQFLESPNTAVLCVDVKRYDVVERFQNVMVLEMD
jgi:nitroimidazol reductase NimA-like FMN-containing flavoprotein (pyridoxamine 5'-phosphate oxidase superfamily)